MMRNIFAMSVGLTLLLFVSSPRAGEYPTGIASVRLGDSKRTVFEKIRESKHIDFDKSDFCKPYTFENWRVKQERRGLDLPCREAINLFDGEFDIEWKFSKSDKLYQIELDHFVDDISFLEGKEDREKVTEFNKRAVSVYSSKYGPPSFINTDAYPYKPYEDSWNYCLRVANWSFPNHVLTEMFVCGWKPSGRTLAQSISFTMKVTDQQELTRVEEDKKKEEAAKKTKEQQRMNKELEKTKELL